MNTFAAAARMAGLWALALATLLLPGTVQAAPQDTHPTAHQGQAEGGLCARGQRQSPIDIPDIPAGAGPALRWDYRSAPLRVVNDGHTVRVRFAPGHTLWLGQERLTLQQFHFHRPGGDRLQGRDFPLGMHFLHKNASGRLVSLVVLLRVGAEHPALAALLPYMPKSAQAEKVLAAVQVNAAQWLPPSHAYYRYEGSLTAAPCTEGVLWLVMQQPMEVSAAQLAHLSTLFGPNARPVQALHGRGVTLTH
jgi:carbonic anhydrase